MPLAFVTLLAGVINAPASAAAQATVTPACGDPVSVTMTRSGLASAVPGVPVCPSPLFTAVISRSGTGPDTAVAVNDTGDPCAPLTDALAAWVPAVLPSVQVVPAIPSASVKDPAGSTAPPPAACQSTCTFGLGTPASVTTTWSAFASGLETVPVWPSPLATALATVRGGGAGPAPVPQAHVKRRPRGGKAR